MAGGNNKNFRNNPCKFLRNHDIRHQQMNVLNDGYHIIDLVNAAIRNTVNITQWNRPGVPNLNPGKRFPGPAPVRAYFLNAQQNRPDAVQRAQPLMPLPAVGPGYIDLGGAANFFLTDEMTGCMLSVYGPAPRVEHMNYQDPARNIVAQQGVYQARANAIHGAYPNALILARQGTCLPAGIPFVTYYNHFTWVIGTREGAGWRFYWRSRGMAREQQL